MSFDAHRNLAVTLVATAPSPPSTGTSLTLIPTTGARFPVPPFNCTVWASAAMPTPANAEVIRVLAMVGDTVTSMLRAQEGTTARAIQVGDLIAETITAKALTDIESGTNFPLITTVGPIHADAGQRVLSVLGGYPGGATTFLRGDGTFAAASASGPPAAHAASHYQGGSDSIIGPMAFASLALTSSTGLITANTMDGSDASIVQVCGGGAPGAARGAYINLSGNEYVSAPGRLDLVAGDAGVIRFRTAPTGLVRGTMHPSGGFGWGDTVDPGAGNLRVAGAGALGELVLANPTLNMIRPATVDGADASAVYVCSGGDFQSSRGASIRLYGNEYSSNFGKIQLVAGVAGTIDFYTGATVLRGTMHANGGFSWGSGQDPKVGTTDVSMSVYGNLAFEGPGEHYFGIRNTPGNDTGTLTLCGGGPTPGGTATANRGGAISVHGINNPGNSGGINMQAANSPGALIKFQTNDQNRMVIAYSGGVMIGTPTDPGAGSLFVGVNCHADAFYARSASPYGINASITARVADFVNYSGINVYPAVDHGGGRYLTFCNVAGAVIGSVSMQAGAASVAFNTTSDQRLKTDRGVLISTDVLLRLVIHDFVWADGTPGRGVFAQEAEPVAPFAVTKGTDERNAEGVLVQPWGVDYSKFVPDLIAGWQQHQAELRDLKAQLAQLRGHT